MRAPLDFGAWASRESAGGGDLPDRVRVEVLVAENPTPTGKGTAEIRISAGRVDLVIPLDARTVSELADWFREVAGKSPDGVAMAELREALATLRDLVESLP